MLHINSSVSSVPTWEKVALDLNEASAYFGIGVNKLREVTNRPECEKYVLWVGKKRLIKRRPFEVYVENSFSI